MLLFEAFKKFLFDSKEELAKFTDEKVKPKAKSYFLLLVILAALAAIPPVVLFYIGALSGSKTAIIVGGVWSAIFLVLFKGAAAPLGIAYEAIRGGTKGSVQRFLGGIEAIFAAKLVFALFACFIPFSNNPSLIPAFLFSAFLIGMLAPGIMKPGVIAGIVIIFFGGIVLSIFFPYTAQKAASGIAKADDVWGKPSRISITCKMPMNFFNQKGEPMTWYYINHTSQDKYELELYNNPGLHSIYREKLIPITPAVARQIERLSNKKCVQQEKKQAKIAKKRKIVQKKMAPAKKQRKRSKNIPPPKKPYSSRYIRDASFLNFTETSEIAVLIIDARNKKAITANKKVSSYFTSESIRAHDSFFNSRFMSDRIFDKMFSGHRNKMIDSELTRHIDYIVLGKKIRKPASSKLLKRQNNPTVGVEIEIRIISARTGMIIDEFTVREDGIGFSAASAEKAAIGTALNNIQKRILKSIV